MNNQNPAPESPTRHSLRLPSYDYSSYGAYFVTFCHHDRQPILNQPEIARILQETWETLPQRFPHLILDEFIIMPDHIHFILWLNTTRKSNVTLGRVVGAYKSLTARAILEYLRAGGKASSEHFWQRNYYEHIIRNDEDLNQTREYIQNNPLKALLLQMERHND
jgi:putative transposase